MFVTFITDPYCINLYAMKAFMISVMCTINKYGVFLKLIKQKVFFFCFSTAETVI